MFKPRKAPAAATSAPPAIEEVRQRAKHRLIGATVLVLAGVVVFPLLFDTQPRPIPVDIPIEIPSRQTAQPLPLPPAKAPTEPVVADSSLSDKESFVAPSAPTEDSTAPPEVAGSVRAGAAAPVSVAAPPSGAAAAAPNKPEAPPAPAAAPAAQRFIVQVGAFADPKLAQQVRLKLERAGLKTYTHVANTPDGQRTRVRLGPFTSRADADKAAAKTKTLGLAPAVLTL